MAEAVEFYFDPMCPYAYQTSVWIRDVRAQIGLDITWRFFSLEEVNRVEGKKHPWERPWSFGWGQMRVGSLIRRELGNDELDRWYATVGSAFFNDGIKTHVPEVHAELLLANGFDPTLVERAIADPATIDDVRADHDHAAAAYGAHGVPTIVRESGTRCTDRWSCPHRPATTRSRCGSSMRGMARFPHLYELRHPKTHDDLVHVAQSFETYLTTRDWNTVENPAP